MSSLSATVVSAPGKVLLAGGYLVLDQAHSGLVVGTASRFYSAVRNIDSKGKASADGPVEVSVRSPQFTDPAWRYSVVYDYGLVDCRIEQIEDGASPNKFVQLALETALKLACMYGAASESSLNVTIVGDNDFYSQQRKPEDDGEGSASIAKEGDRPFAYLRTSLRDVHKTGLGSSAAMVTSLIAAVFLHLTQPVHADKVPASTMGLIHNAAQYAHSRAQGKVGSGFDVSAAVFGSQIYRRFSPDCLTPLLELASPSAMQLRLALELEAPSWTPGSATAGTVIPFSLPPGTALILADVDAGSNTPSMVGKVLKWKSEKPGEAASSWKHISELSSQLARTFTEASDLSRREPEGYKKVVSNLAQRPSSQASLSQIEGVFVRARDIIQAIRLAMKAMGVAASVPIEPDEQTRLLNSTCQECSGIVGGGVPGAGGYDATWVLVLEGGPGEAQARQLWAAWTEMSVRPLSEKARIVGGEGRDEAERGLRRHLVAEVEGLKSILH